MADDLLSRVSLMPSAMELSSGRQALKAENIARTTGATKSEAELQKTAQDFEGMLLQQMFQAMWRAVPQNDLLGGGREAEYYRDMFIEGLSNDVAHGQGIGIKEVILKELKDQEKGS